MKSLQKTPTPSLTMVTKEKVAHLVRRMNKLFEKRTKGKRKFLQKKGENLRKEIHPRMNRYATNAKNVVTSKQIAPS